MAALCWLHDAFPGVENTTDWWANTMLLVVGFVWLWQSMRFEDEQ